MRPKTWLYICAVTYANARRNAKLIKARLQASGKPPHARRQNFDSCYWETYRNVDDFVEQ